MVGQPLRVLLVEDNPGDARLVREALQETGSAQFELVHVERLADALERTGEEHFDVVLLDLALPDSQGLETFARLQRQATDVPIVVLTGTDDDVLAIYALKAGAQDYFVKGQVHGNLLFRAIRYAIERKRAQEMLQETSETLRALVEAAPVSIIAVDPDGIVTMWNPAAERLFGWGAEEALRRPHPVMPEDKQDEFRAILETILQRTPLSDLEVRRQRKDGSPVDLSISVAPMCDTGGIITGMMGVAIDITERKRAEQEKVSLEAQLRQAQRMEAIGRLAGGIAHDFNNLLMVINGQCQLLLRRLGPEDPIRADIEEVNRAGERAADLTRQLLAFGRKQVGQQKVLDLNGVVTGIERMLRRLIGEDIVLVTVLQPGLGRVKADLGQMEQVLANLVVNARDAMPEGGRLTIETVNVELDEAYTSKHVGVEPGPYVMLAVTDTGVGMDAETRSHIFEPFFTTKERGKGTGLGLATVYGIVEQHGGYLGVSSEPGGGTTFQVYFPRPGEDDGTGGSGATTAEPRRQSQTI